MKRSYLVAAALVGAASFTTSVEAKPKGFLAKHVIGPIAGPKAAEQADRLHEKVGKPLDRLLEHVIRTGR